MASSGFEPISLKVKNGKIPRISGEYAVKEKQMVFSDISPIMSDIFYQLYNPCLYTMIHEIIGEKSPSYDGSSDWRVSKSCSI